MGDKGTKIVGPVRANNAIKIYNILESRSEIIKTKDLLEYGYPAKDSEEEIRIFRGFSTKLPQSELGMLTSATHHGLSLLKAMNAITLLVTGNKLKPSIYLLNFKPTLADVEKFADRRFMIERRTSPTVYDQINNELAIIRDRLDNAERKIRELEARIESDGNNVRTSKTLS